MPQMIQLIDKDVKTTSINMLHMFKKVEESISRMRNEGYKKDPYKTSRDGKQRTVISEMKGHTTSKWQT